FAGNSLTQTRGQRRVVTEAGAAVQNGDGVRRLRFPMVRPVEDQRGVGDFPDELIACQVGPLGLEQVIRIRVRSRVSGFGRNQRTAAEAEVGVLNVVRDIQFVLRGRLVGESNAGRSIVLLL